MGIQPTLTQDTQYELAILGFVILWLFLRAARYQRELDLLDRVATHKD